MLWDFTFDLVTWLVYRFPAYPQLLPVCNVIAHYLVIAEDYTCGHLGTWLFCSVHAVG